jgi:hypothetical protein
MVWDRMGSIADVPIDGSLTSRVVIVGCLEDGSDASFYPHAISVMAIIAPGPTLESQGLIPSVDALIFLGRVDDDPFIARQNLKQSVVVAHDLYLLFLLLSVTGWVELYPS